MYFSPPRSYKIRAGDEAKILNWYRTKWGRSGRSDLFAQVCATGGRGAAKTGAKLVIEEGLRKMGLDSKEAIDAVWATVERVARESP